MNQINIKIADSKPALPTRRKVDPSAFASDHEVLDKEGKVLPYEFKDPYEKARQMGLVGDEEWEHWQAIKDEVIPESNSPLP